MFCWLCNNRVRALEDGWQCGHCGNGGHFAHPVSSIEEAEARGLPLRDEYRGPVIMLGQGWIYYEGLSVGVVDAARERFEQLERVSWLGVVLPTAKRVAIFRRIVSIYREFS